MENNAFTTVGILTVLLLSLGMVSAMANIQFSNINFPTIYNNQTTAQFTFDVTYGLSGSENMNISFDHTITNVAGITISIPIELGMNGTADETREVIGVISGLKGKSAQTVSVTLNASTTGDSFNFTTTSFQILEAPTTPNTPATTYCSDGDAFKGENGTLEIKNFFIDYIGSGDDEKWEALDEIRIEVDVKNNDNDERVDNILVEIKILDSSNRDVTSDFNFEDETDKLGRISKKTTETAVFTIKELPTDVEEGNYKIYVRAYDEEDESAQCVSKSNDFNHNSGLFHEFEVVRENEAVIIKDSDLLSKTVSASCGDKSVEVSFPVYNLGDETEDKVLVNLFNKELNINEFYVIDSLRSGKGKTATFFVDLPEGLSKTRYDLDIITFFTYDEDGDELDRTTYDENSLDDLDKDFSIRLEILSCQGPKPTISASLDSEAKVGKELVLIATLINNGEDNSFDLSASGYESWGELVSISPQSLSLGKDEEGTFAITLIPNKGGVQTINVNSISSDGGIHSQAVSIKIAEEDKALFADVNKTVIYSVAGIAALVILIFLTLIVKVSRRSTKAPQF
jgi:hypothetical protein